VGISSVDSTTASMNKNTYRTELLSIVDHDVSLLLISSQLKLGAIDLPNTSSALVVAGQGVDVVMP